MDYQGFISTVKERADVSDEEAQHVACATLRTLAERLSSGETGDLAERLPGELRTCLVPEDTGDRRFHADEFLKRISRRAGVGEEAAQRDASAVFVALERAVGPREFDDMRSELPQDFEALLAAAAAEAAEPRSDATNGGGSPAISLDDFLRRIQDRTGLDRAAAQRAAETVLEVLAIRITRGQVEDLAELLPPELRGALERGIQEFAAAKPLSDDTFVREVASREPSSRAQAYEQIRAVFAALREMLPQKEWSDTVAQLPDEYRPLMRED